jgi:O-antigen/teichoic acid export membrane protein
MLGILWLTVHFLGEEGRGEIAIFNVNLSFVILINGLVGSSVIVYLTPRTNFYNLLIPACAWALISSILSPLLLQNIFHFVGKTFNIDTVSLGLENTEYYFLLVICSFLGSMFEYHYMVLIGKNEIFKANLLNFIRNLFIVLSMVFIFVNLGIAGDVYGYFVSMVFAYFMGYLVSLYFILKLPDSIRNLSELKKYSKQIIQLGFIDQLSNILQFFNKRLPMYTLYMVYGKGNTGVLSVAITLSESFWFLSQSVSTVQYAEIANNKNAEKSQEISLKMFRLSLVLLFLGMFGLLIFPQQFYVWLFKKEFVDFWLLLCLLSVGTVAYGAAGILNHYFSGIGKFQENVYSNLISLFFTIFIGCTWLIPTLGMKGAAISTSISYLILLIYLTISFRMKTKKPFSSFIPKRADLKELIQLIKNSLKK